MDDYVASYRKVYEALLPIWVDQVQLSAEHLKPNLAEWAIHLRALLWKAFQHKYHKINLNFGVSLPTGDIDQKDIILTPMGMQPKSVLPYWHAVRFWHL